MFQLGSLWPGGSASGLKTREAYERLGLGIGFSTKSLLQTLNPKESTLLACTRVAPSVEAFEFGGFEVSECYGLRVVIFLRERLNLEGILPANVSLSFHI